MAPPAYGVHARLITTLRTLALALRSAKLHSAALMLAALLPVAAGATVHVACTPGHLSFGKVLVGEKKTLSATLSNTGSSAIKLLSLQLDNSKFAVSGLSFPLVLSAGKTTKFSVVFAPKSADPENGQLLIKGLSGISLTIPAYGSGVKKWSLSASPSSLAFGNVAVGSHSELTVTLTNSRLAARHCLFLWKPDGLPHFTSPSSPNGEGNRTAVSRYRTPTTPSSACLYPEPETEPARLSSPSRQQL
jgi:hypothetical protein